MLREAARLLAPAPGALIASTSFATRARLALLAATAPPLGLRHRVHALGGDPSRGHEVSSGAAGHACAARMWAHGARQRLHGRMAHACLGGHTNAQVMRAELAD